MISRVENGGEDVNDFSVTKDRRVFLDGAEVKGVLGVRVFIEADKDPEVELRVAVGSITIDGYTDVFKGVEDPVLKLEIDPKILGKANYGKGLRALGQSSD